MARLGRTIANLSKYRDRWAKMLASAPLPGEADAPPTHGHLKEVKGFGSNPGNLRMLTYVPEHLRAPAPLVVVLHGCTQTAAGYDIGAGWSTLADRYGFALLFPEQQQANNANVCFNWFRAGDIRRGRGEPASIRQMIERMARDHRIDKTRVFVTGLSAGGAMTAVMLATYPEVFAGGAIIAGLPYGCATSVQDAFDCMFQGRARSAREWGDLVRAASPHRGPWPTLSVWHGAADTTVAPMNAGEILKQWTDVHGLPETPAGEDVVDGYPRQVWRDAQGREIIESFTITGMAHGTPLAVGDGEDHYGAAGPFMLDAGISSTYHIAKFWGLTDHVVRPAAADVAIVSSSGVVEFAKAPARAGNGSGTAAASRPEHPKHTGATPPVDIHAIINKALKAAGLKS